MVRKSTVLSAGAALLLASAVGAHQFGTFKPLFEPSKKSTLCQVVADSSRSIGTQVNQETGPGVRIIDGVFHVFYDTNSHRILPEERRKLEGYLRFFPENSSFIVDGFADYRHDEPYNERLSIMRAESVVPSIRKALPRSSVKTIGHGKTVSRPEGTDLGRIVEDRRARIFPVDKTLNASRNLFSADYYLVDSSEKMGDQIEPTVGVTRWDVVNLYPFPANAQVYAFNSIRRDCKGNLADEKPKGKNNLFSDLIDFIENKAQPNTSITVLTATDPQSYDVVLAYMGGMDKARRKGIKVSFLYLGNDPNYAESLQTFAKQTGGDMYHKPNFLKSSRNPNNLEGIPAFAAREQVQANGIPTHDLRVVAKLPPNYRLKQYEGNMARRAA